MSFYEEVMRLMEERFGGGEGNIVTLATVRCAPSANGHPCPAVRDVDAVYENGVFYVTTYANSNKMRQIAKNPEVAISVEDWFTANAQGENLGWALDEKNAAIRDKLRAAHADLYDKAFNERDPNCCILAIRPTRATLDDVRWPKPRHLDFVNQTELEDADDC